MNSDPNQRLTHDSASRKVPFPLLWHCVGHNIMWNREVLESRIQQETTTRHWSKSYLFYYKTKIKQMPFSLTNNAIGRNVLGQGKFNINSGHGKRCLHMDESHRNAVPSNTPRPWRISKKGKIFASGRKNR